MREKNKLWTSVALMLLVVAIMAGVGPVYASPTTMQLEDRGTGKTGTPGDPVTYGVGVKFNVSVNVIDVNNLGGWAVDVEWNPNILSYTGLYGEPPTWPLGAHRMWEGTWFSSAAAAALKGTSWTTVGPEKTANNTIYHMADTILPLTPATPALNTTEGDLMYFELEVVGYGDTWINITFYDLKDHSNVLITNSTYDAPVNCYFSNPPPGAYGPTADFDYSPKVIWENTIVRFWANLSTPGFDNTTVDWADIALYSWDFNGNGTVDLATSNPNDPLAVFNYTTEGDYNVNLTVYAPNGAGPQFEYDTKIEALKVYRVAASKIDVQTAKSWLGNTTLYRERGVGPNLPGSAFMPGETVTLVSDLLYEELPVTDVNVGFQVGYPADTPFASLSAKTDIAGRAEVSFRMPQTPQPPFGLYSVVSTARVFEEDFVDTLEFYVGWIVEINSVTVTTDPVDRGDTATIALNITNNDPWNAYPAVLTASIFDKLAQSVGTDSSVVSIAVGTDVYNVYVTIAGFAWPGPATAKANALTDYPASGGSAYCPEKSDIFEITLPP